MAKTTIKLNIAIDQQRIGYYTRGEMIISDMLFSEASTKLMDAEELIAEVKNVVKMMKGWTMLTISLTDDIEYTPYPKEVDSVRFINHYGEVKFAQVENHYYSNWNVCKISKVYDVVREVVKQANNLQLNKVANRTNELV